MIKACRKMGVRTRGWAGLLPSLLAVGMMGGSTSAHAQDEASPQEPAPPPSPSASAPGISAPVSSPPDISASAASAPDGTAPDRAALDRAECRRQLLIAEDALERDGKYARNWTDAWYVTGASIITLSIASIFQYHDYRVAEQVVDATLGTLLMIEVPDATTNHRALQGIRTASLGDPCLALTSARYLVEVNADDAAKHQTAFTYILPIALNVVVGAIVASAVGHWEFAGHGDEGLASLIGIAASELQTVTFPSPSIKFTGSSVQAAF